MIEDIANYFSDETLTFMLLIISILLAAIAYIPAYRAEVQAKEFKELTKNLKPKQKPPVFELKSNIVIWRGFFFVAAFGIFIGVLKYTKDGLESIKYQDQKYKYSNAIDTIAAKTKLIDTIVKQLNDSGKTINGKGEIIQKAGMIVNGNYNKINGGIFTSPKTN